MKTVGEGGGEAGGEGEHQQWYCVSAEEYLYTMQLFNKNIWSF